MEIKENSAGAVIYCLEEGEPTFLILKHKGLSTHWGFPKGRKEEGETEIENAKREIKEEANISVEEFDPEFKFTTKYSFERPGKLINKEVTFFLLKVTKEEIKISDEHSESFWGTYEQVKEKLIGSDKELIDKAYDYVKSKN